MTRYIQRNDAIVIDGVSYNITQVDYEGCGTNCLLLNKDFEGSTVQNSAPYYGVFKETTIARTTADLRAYKGKTIWIDDETFTVSDSKCSAVCTLDLMGAFTVARTGATAFANANGFEWGLVFKSTTADLKTFRAVPESDWVVFGLFQDLRLILEDLLKSCF